MKQPPTPFHPKTASLLLLLAVAALYGNFLGNPLVFDDLNMLTNEKLLSDYARSFFAFDLRWFSYVTFGWVHNLLGGGLVWQRLLNLLLHACLVLALYQFSTRLLLLEWGEAQARRLAFWGALIFALHPLAVYGAGYLIQRSIVMAALFSVLALHVWLHGLERQQARWLYLSALLYFVAVFSKEHAVMLPGALVALALLRRRLSLRQLALPLALCALVALTVTLKAKGLLGQPYEPFAVQMLAAQAENQLQFQVEHAYPLSILLQSALFFKYLWLWLVPWVGWMSVDLRVAFPGGLFTWPNAAGLLAFAVYPLIAGWLLLRGGRKGVLGFALLFPWLMFVAELAAIRIQEPFVLYRSYLWMLFVPVTVAAAVASLAPRRASVVLGLLVALLVPSAWNRLEVFSSELALWEDAIAKYADAELPGRERGVLNRGLAKKKLGQFEEAMVDYQRALAINPGYYVAYSNLGSAKIDQQRYEDALGDLDQAIRLNPRYANAWSNRGMAKKNLGRYHEALADYNSALAISPDEAFILSNRAALYLAMQRYADALRDAERAITLNPRFAPAYFNRALALRGLEQTRPPRHLQE